MKNQAQVNNDSNSAEGTEQSQTPPVGRLFRKGSFPHSKEAGRSIADLFERPEDQKPSESEAILFAEIFRFCTDHEERRYGCAMAQLRGFHELIQENPRIRPLANAIKAMVDADSLLNEVTRSIDRS